MRRAVAVARDRPIIVNQNIRRLLAESSSAAQQRTERHVTPALPVLAITEVQMAPESAPISEPDPVLIPAVSKPEPEPVHPVVSPPIQSHTPVLAQIAPVISPLMDLPKPILVHSFPLMHNNTQWELITFAPSESNIQFNTETNTLRAPPTLTSATVISAASQILSHYPDAQGIAISVDPVPIMESPDELISWLYHILEGGGVWLSTYILKVITHHYRDRPEDDLITLLSDIVDRHALPHKLE